jgi:DNA-nicking Smr family endonuclease
MAKKRRAKSSNEAPGPRAAKPGFTSPFKELTKLIKERDAVRPAKPPAPVAKSSSREPPTVERQTLLPVDDVALLREALAGVRPLGASGAARVGVEPPVGRSVVSEDAEVLAELSDLVSGQGRFELTETEEYVEGARLGLDPRLVSRLRRGEFSTQGHIDLHGMTQANAKEALTRFVVESVRKGHRSVLVVHGRGRRSPGGQPVLKHAAAQWLSHGAIGGYVLAFTTAQSYDGGGGAVWVLLRRERKRAKFDILEGAKRRD